MAIAVVAGRTHGPLVESGHRGLLFPYKADPGHFGGRQLHAAATANAIHANAPRRPSSRAQCRLLRRMFFAGASLITPKHLPAARPEAPMPRDAPAAPTTT